MKKLSLFASLLIFSSMSLFAEGYQVNTLSAKQIALGHTGVSQKLGAESMYFNPAGLAFTDKQLDVSVGVAGIASQVTGDIVVGKDKQGNKIYREYETDNKVSTPLYAYAAFRIYDNLKAGVAFYTPYGSSIDWGQNWPGAILSQKVKLTSYAIQPTVSWRILKNLSIGAGVTVTWGSVDLNKALVTPQSLDMLIGKPVFGDITPVSANLKGTSEVAVGFNIGAMYDINEKVTVGASFRSKTRLQVKSGDVRVTYANEMAQKLLENKIGLINSANFAAEMPLPYTFTFGASYRPNSRIEISGDVQLTGWSAYKQLDIDFISDKLDRFDQHLKKNYHNAFAFRLGVKYSLTKRFDLRAGLSYDMTPVDDEYYNPETPGMDKISPAFGFTFRPFPHFSVDVACAYIAGLGADNVSYQYDDPLIIDPNTKKPIPQPFNGNFKVTAWSPSLSIGYSF